MSEHLTVDQVATILHVSPTTVRRWIYKGKLKARKVRSGKNGRVLIDRAEVDQLLAPASQRKPRQTLEERKKLVERILAFRRRIRGRNIDVDALIDENRQERDRECLGD